MRVAIFVFSIVCAVTFAEEITPSQVEASFVGGVSSLPQLIAQEQFQRRLADIFLGFQVSSNFQQYGQFQLQLSSPSLVPEAQLEEDDENGDDQANIELEEHSGEDDDDDDVSLLQLKEEFIPLGASAPAPALSAADLMKYRHVAKTSAIKGLQLQLFLAGHDVERSFWTNKVVTALLPPQIATFKLYKMYLNTLALTIAYQLHDVFTLEAFMENFNVEYSEAQQSGNGQMIESVAESHVFKNWQMLAMIKFQLFFINMYESYIAGYAVQAMAQQQPQQHATSFVEVDSEFVGGANQNPLMVQYAYLSYFVMLMKYYSVYLEMSLASTGAMAAQLKINPNTQGVEDSSKVLEQLDGVTLPSLFSQWGAVNQYRYMMEYWIVMLDLYTPQLAPMRSAERAENTFQNLVQTEPAELSTTTPAVESPEQPHN